MTDEAALNDIVDALGDRIFSLEGKRRTFILSDRKKNRLPSHKDLFSAQFLFEQKNVDVLLTSFSVYSDY